MKFYLKTQNNNIPALVLAQISIIKVNRNILYTIHIFSPNLVLYSSIYSNQSILGIIPNFYSEILIKDTKK